MQAKDIYDKSASAWERKQPNILTDFSVRPLIFELCKDLTNKSVLDLGCGEGYVSRYCKSHGASKVLGIDISSGMIEKALIQEQEQPLGIDYQNLSVTDASLPTATFDIVLGVFVFNYLTIAETKHVFKNIYNCLSPGGRFIFALPHPSWPFLCKHEPPTYFDCANYGYFSGRDKKFLGKIWCINDSVLDIQLFHKTFTDIFACLQSGNFKAVPIIYEVPIPKEFINAQPNLSKQNTDLPVHLVISIEK